MGTRLGSRAGLLPVVLGLLLVFTACGQQTRTPVVLVYVDARALTSCPHPVLVNHGPDPVRSGSSRVLVGSTASLLGSSTPAFSVTVDALSIPDAGAAPAFDLGFRCSDSLPELRQAYPLYSLLTLSQDAGEPSGLRVEVRQLYLPD